MHAARRLTTCLVSVAVLAAATLAPPLAPVAAAQTDCGHVSTYESNYPNPLHNCPAADPGMIRIDANTWYMYAPPA